MASVRVGVELEAPAAGGGPGWDAWREAALAAEECGVDAVWVAGGPDPATLAGALAAATTSVTLGVISGVGAGDRNPSVLARDVTAVDVLSSGRAAVMLEGPAAPAAEAARVCRLLFAGGEAHHTGPRFHMDGAVNLPPPVGSPAVLVHSPAPPRGAGADGWVTSVGPDALAIWRREAGGTVLRWRGPPGEDPSALAAALFERGVDGLILWCPPSAGEVASLARRLP